MTPFEDSFALGKEPLKHGRAINSKPALSCGVFTEFNSSGYFLCIRPDSQVHIKPRIRKHVHQRVQRKAVNLAAHKIRDPWLSHLQLPSCRGLCQAMLFNINAKRDHHL